MVSEGVDIPCLRVGIYATNKTTELFFRQFVGRMVRRVRDLENDSDAYVYLPADARIVEFAKRIKEERDHVLEQKNVKRREVIEGLTRQLSMFSAFSGTAIANGVISNGEILAEAELECAATAREEISKICGVPLSREVVARMARFFRANSAGTSAPPAPEKVARAKLREELRRECNRLQRAACMRHTYDFAKTNRWLNERIGADAIELATVDQLTRRLELINEVLLAGKWT
jgi:superfamily II DNA or RNA helicase